MAYSCYAPLQKMTYSCALAAGVRMARLPIEEHMVRRPNAKNFHSKILAINQGKKPLATWVRVPEGSLVSLSMTGFLFSTLPSYLKDLLVFIELCSLLWVFPRCIKKNLWEWRIPALSIAICHFLFTVYKHISHCLYNCSVWDPLGIPWHRELGEGAPCRGACWKGLHFTHRKLRSGHPLPWSHQVSNAATSPLIPSHQIWDLQLLETKMDCGHTHTHHK